MNVKYQIGLTLVLACLLVSCAQAATQPIPTATPTRLTPPTEELSPSSASILPSETPGASPLSENPGTNCADEKVNKLGEAIASSYAFTSTQEVMTWFCDGAEFEDILVALESEELTGTAAEDLLLMRADGLSWDEIWEVIGLYDD